jgi:hypothetical protein
MELDRRKNVSIVRTITHLLFDEIYKLQLPPLWSMIRFFILLSDNLPSKGYDPISPIRHQQMHWVALWVKALGNITSTNQINV